MNYGNFKTLTSALQTADLLNTLQNVGTFTIFAPDDSAFNKLGLRTLTDLLKPSSRAKLIRILRYHVIPGERILSSQINSMYLPVRKHTLDGNQITISRFGNSLRIDNATVIRSDIVAGNGVIHVIDRVLTPPKLNFATSFSTNQSLSFIFILVLVSFCIRFF